MADHELTDNFLEVIKMLAEAKDFDSTVMRLALKPLK